MSPHASTRWHSWRRNIHEALLPAFAAFLLLLYNKLSLTSISHQALIIDENGVSQPSAHAYYAQFKTSDHKYIHAYNSIFTFMSLHPSYVLLLCFSSSTLSRPSSGSFAKWSIFRGSTLPLKCMPCWTHFMVATGTTCASLLVCTLCSVWPSACSTYLFTGSGCNSLWFSRYSVHNLLLQFASLTIERTKYSTLHLCQSGSYKCFKSLLIH